MSRWSPTVGPNDDGPDALSRALDDAISLYQQGKQRQRDNAADDEDRAYVRSQRAGQARRNQVADYDAGIRRGVRPTQVRGRVGEAVGESDTELADALDSFGPPGEPEVIALPGQFLPQIGFAPKAIVAPKPMDPRAARMFPLPEKDTVDNLPEPRRGVYNIPMQRQGDNIIRFDEETEDLGDGYYYDPDQTRAARERRETDTRAQREENELAAALAAAGRGDRSQLYARRPELIDNDPTLFPRPESQRAQQLHEMDEPTFQLLLKRTEQIEHVRGDERADHRAPPRSGTGGGSDPNRVDNRQKVLAAVRAVNAIKENDFVGVDGQADKAGYHEAQREAARNYGFPTIQALQDAARELGEPGVGGGSTSTSTTKRGTTSTTKRTAPPKTETSTGAQAVSREQAMDTIAQWQKSGMSKEQIKARARARGWIE